MEHWKNHFRMMAKGKVQPNNDGVFVVDKKNTPHKKPEVKLEVISPTQQAVNQAKAVIKKSIRGGSKPPGSKALW